MAGMNEPSNQRVIPMKRTLSAVALATASTFAFDQYLPVAPKALETDVMYSYTANTGGYDPDGKKQDFEDLSPAVQAPSLALKYGIIPGLDAELALAYSLKNKDAGDVSGLDRPQIAVKYAHPELGVGGFVNVSVPVGSEDIVSKDPITTIAGGAIYGKAFGQVKVNAFAQYVFNTEAKETDEFTGTTIKTKQDNYEVYAQGQYDVTPQIGPYLGVDYAGYLEKQYDGEGAPDSDGYLLTLKPGANYVINDKFAAEATVPVTVLGKSQPATWGVYVGVYYTLGL